MANAEQIDDQIDEIEATPATQTIAVQIVDPGAAAAEGAEKRAMEEKATYKINLMFGGMIGNNIFYARIMSNFKRTPKWDPKLTIGTQLLDGRVALTYRPDYVINAGHIELMDRIEHECVHLLNEHPTRSMQWIGASSIAEFRSKLRADKDTRHSLNLAVDFAANYELYSNKNEKKPVEGNWPMANDAPFKFSLNKTADEYFNALQRSLPMKGQKGNNEGEDSGQNTEQEGTDKSKGKGKKSGGSGSGEKSLSDTLDTLDSQHDWYDKDYNESESQALFAEIGGQVDAAIRRAEIEQTKSRGTIPARYQEMINQRIKKSKIPWNKLLKQKVLSSFLATKNHCYFKPDRKRVAIDPYGNDTSLFPSLRKQIGYTIVFAIDTSGSMSKEALSLGAAELLALAKRFVGSRIIVIQCDYLIEHEYELETSDQLTDKMKKKVYYTHGGGGTSFEPPFERALYGNKVQPKSFANLDVFENRVKNFPKKIDAFVYFTDGYAPPPARSLAPRCNTIWVLTPGGTEEGTSTFGKVVTIDGDAE